jgi:hypothetical protein
LLKLQKNFEIYFLWSEHDRFVDNGRVENSLTSTPSTFPELAVVSDESFYCPVKHQFPLPFHCIVANDIRCVIIANNLKIAMIRGQPPIQHFYHLDFIGGHPDAARGFFAAVSGVALYLNSHERPPTHVPCNWLIWLPGLILPARYRKKSPTTRLQALLKISLLVPPKLAEMVTRINTLTALSKKVSDDVFASFVRKFSSCPAQGEMNLMIWQTFVKKVDPEWISYTHKS